MNNSETHTRYFDKYCATYTINSLGPKKSRTKFFEKIYLPGDKSFWPVFSRIIVCNKLHGTFSKGSTGMLTITKEVIGAFF